MRACTRVRDGALRQGMVALLVVAVSVQVAEGRGTGTGAGETRSRKTEAASKEKTEKTEKKEKKEKTEKKEKDNNNKKKQEQEHGIARQQLICKQSREIRGYCAVPGDPGSRSRLFTLRLKRRSDMALHANLFRVQLYSYSRLKCGLLGSVFVGVALISCCAVALLVRQGSSL